jgi:UDP-N-acetyl-2-amino-2-deoxyglucuronate dehydrogenase
MSGAVKFGIIGCGGIGKAHARAITGLPDAELVAVCDIRPERAEAYAAEFGCEAYSDYAAMLGRDDVQVVNVCTPSGLHAEHGIAAAEAGKHVITEKPIDIVLDKIDRLIQTCDRRGVKLACIFQERFRPEGRKVKAAIDEGKFGELLFGNASVKWYRAQSYYDSDTWRGTWALDGGVLSNQAIHYLDQILWLVGDVAEVTFAEISTKARKMEAEDIAQATLHFKNGAWGSIQASTLTWPGTSSRVEVCGTTGIAVLEGGLTFYRVEGEEEQVEAKVAAAGASADPAIAALTGHDAQIADFIIAIREGRDPYVTGREGRRAVALLTEIYHKATGRAMLGGS